MKPILKPIIDISYYLPEFSGFNPKDLFLPENDNKIFKLNMDLDKVLKITEQNIAKTGLCPPFSVAPGGLAKRRFL